MKRTPTEFTRKSFILSKDTMDKFEVVCDKLNLGTSELLEVTVELFLNSKIWEEAENESHKIKQDC